MHFVHTLTCPLASHLDLSSLSTHNRTAVVLPINVCCLRRRKRSEQRDDRGYGYAHRYQKCPHVAPQMLI